MEGQEIVAVKAVLDSECKRFGIPKTSTFSNLVDTLCNVFACEIDDIQYRDGDDDLVTMGSEEEFTLSLKTVPKTGDILRLVLRANSNGPLQSYANNISPNHSIPEANHSQNVLHLHSGETSAPYLPAFGIETSTMEKCSFHSQSEDMEFNDQTLINENDMSIEEANRRSLEMLTTIESGKQQTVIAPVVKDCSDGKGETKKSEARKSSNRHKIESASRLSKDLFFDTCEVTGRIPVLTQSSVCNLDSHFSSQKPVARKVRRVSSGTTSAGTDKNDKKQGRGRQTQRKKKRKHRDSSSSSSDSSSSRSSASSSTSSSESSCVENYQYYKKTGKKKKRKSSPSVNIEKMLHKCEKHITSKVCKDFEKYTKKFKEEIISSVSNTILQRLDGAVLQSFVVPNGGSAQPSDVNVGANTSKPGEGVAAKRIRYQHQNVVCDHCENEIFGPRYKCGNCSDYDLCEKCEAIEGLHTPSHVFVKMHFPAVHAGRRSVGGKSRPLLRANIYEEREKEREMEDLLQRKLDSGSELNQKVLEKIEKRRTKMKEDEQAKEAYDNRKEEWKKMKKEIKKNKKELKKKLKQQGKMIQRNITRGCNNKEDSFLKKEGFCFDVENLHKVDQKIMKEPNLIETNNTKVENKIPDENLSSALSSLQIVEPVLVNEVNVSENASIGSSSNENIIDLTMDSDDVVVVERISPLHIEHNATPAVSEVLKKPDLVDFNRDVSKSPTSEDFVVVSNYFDLSIPIDDKHVLEHRNCESCQNCLHNFTPDFIRPHSSCTSINNQLPVDLVASVPVTARNQPDIASPTTVNIMDQSIESLSSVSSSPPISPEPVNVNLFDENLQHGCLIQPCNEVPHSPEIEIPLANQELFTQPSNTNEENENEANKAILIHPDQLDVVTINQSETHVSENIDNVVNINEQVIIDDISSAPLNTDNVTIEQSNVDLNNPTNSAQVNEEQSISKNCLKPVTLNSFESTRNGISDISEPTLEQLDERVLCPVSPTDVSSNSNGGGISGALVGAMASFVDTVAHVVQSAKGSPKAEYHNGEVEVTIPVDPRIAGMQQLLDMGFFDRPLNERLLTKYNNDVGRCVTDLCAENNNQWHQTRH